jgi:dipeptidyl aminopeptidase/acylaminoacyl peptidase
LKDFSLGRVEFIDWKDKQGRAWRARLYHPVTGSEHAQRVPLVIQTHGYAPHGEFSLYGMGGSVHSVPGLGPGISIYAAQPLANHSIAVLQIGDDEVWPLLNTPEEARAFNDAYESAVEYLVGRGLVDASRVGITGFSRTGWPVMYALTHSSLHYAAALVSDSSDGGYIQAAVAGWSPLASSSITGAEPFGQGLKTWFENAPPFAIDKLNTPLRVQIENSRVLGFLGMWEVYSRARYLHKPVEFYVIPNIDRGSHNIQNPEQCLASQQGAVDFFVAHLHP